tara:strand:+ start:17240 stop:17659 length:420 start_codon:yes stop_codon:yes gene_type:complete
MTENTEQPTQITPENIYHSQVSQLDEITNKSRSSLTVEDDTARSALALSQELEELIRADRDIEAYFAIGEINYKASPNNPISAILASLKDVIAQDRTRRELDDIRNAFEAIDAIIRFLPTTENKKIVAALTGIALYSLQ